MRKLGSILTGETIAKELENAADAYYGYYYNTEDIDRFLKNILDRNERKKLGFANFAEERKRRAKLPFAIFGVKFRSYKETKEAIKVFKERYGKKQYLDLLDKEELRKDLTAVLREARSGGQGLTKKQI